MLRICFLADAGSIHTRKIANYFIQNGDEVFVISLHPGEIKGAKVYLIPSLFKQSVTGNNWHYIFTFPKIKCLLTKINPKLVCAQYLTSYGLIGAMCGIKPFCLRLQGTDIKITSGKNWFYQYLTRFTLKRADLIIAVAEHIAQDVYQFGIPPHKVLVMQYGVDDAVFYPNHKIDINGEFELICTRDFVPNSNHENLLNALALVRQARPQTKLLLLGDGFLRQEIEHKAHRLGLANNVKFFGKVSQDKVSQYLNQSKVYISLTHSDGTSQSLLEAMACGLVPIVSDIKANREWIKHASNGFLTLPADIMEVSNYILIALSNDTFRSKMAEINVSIIRARGLYRNNMYYIAQKLEELALSPTNY